MFVCCAKTSERSVRRRMFVNTSMAQDASALLRPRVEAGQWMRYTTVGHGLVLKSVPKARAVTRISWKVGNSKTEKFNLAL